MLLQQYNKGLLLGAFLCLGAQNVSAGSCCGGGTGANILLSKMGTLMIDTSSSVEYYDGYWDKAGHWKEDPAGSDLNQYRVSLGAAYRFADRWQASISIPYVDNRNQYSGLESNTRAVGDTSLSLWYEAFDNAMCVFKVRQLSDLRPAIYYGLGLTIPTGVSPYDDVQDNFDITGRGFYAMDARMIIDKTVYPFTAAINLGYGIHFERPVNRDYGTYVEPYDKKLGNRASASLSLGYVVFMKNLSELTTTAGINYLTESQAVIAGVEDSASGMKKLATSLGMSWTSPEKKTVVKASWSHALQGDNWGENFPTTDVVSLGVSYVLF